MRRTIHLKGAAFLVVFYISLAVFINAYIRSSGEFGFKYVNSLSKFKEFVITGIISGFVLAIATTGVLVIGVGYLAKLDEANQSFKNTNVCVGVSYFLGGFFGIGLILSIYLYVRE